MTQPNIINITYMYILNRAILVNLQRRPLKLGRLIVLQVNSSTGNVKPCKNAYKSVCYNKLCF